MPKLLKDAFILCVITLTAGALLAGVYEITKEPIRIQEELKQQNACKEVFANASSFEAEDTLIEKAQTIIEDAGFESETIESVMVAKDDTDTSLGYIIQITTAEGYGGDITFMVGVQNDGTLNGISILSIDETAGLGMNADTDSFKSQFENKNVETFTYTKTGSTKDSEIDAISGATVTTKAMLKGVNAALSAANTLAKEGE